MARPLISLLLGVIEHRIKQRMIKNMIKNRFIDDKFVIDPWTRSDGGSFKVREKIIFVYKHNVYLSFKYKISNKLTSLHSQTNLWNHL